MNVNLLGKSVYTWSIPSIFGGDVNAIARALKLAGFQSAILHDASLANWRTPARVNLVYALKAAGVSPIGGAAVYGYDPVSEGQQAAALCNLYGLEAFVFDAESTFDGQATPDSNAVKLLTAFHAAAPTARSGWCWWAMYQNPATGSAWHPKKVLWAAMQYADFGLPMAYWDADSDPGDYLQHAWDQWRAVTDKPIVPIGRAYVGDSGKPTPESVSVFEAKARTLGAVGCSWWSMQHALTIPAIWDALSGLAPFEVDPALVGLRFKVIEPAGMKIRSSPSIPLLGGSNVVGSLPFGTVVMARNVAYGSGGAWIQFDRGWVCVQLGAKRYMEPVS